MRYAIYQKMQELLGARLISIHENGFSVAKDGKTYDFEYVKDDGDYSGYSTIKTNLYLSSDENKELNPVITNITFINKAEEENYTDREEIEIVFFGLEEEIYNANCMSSSYSGWCYGANVRLICKALNFDEIITSW